MSSNIYALMSDDYLIATALQRDSLSDLEQELVKRLDAHMHSLRFICDAKTACEKEHAENLRRVMLECARGLGRPADGVAAVWLEGKLHE